MGLEEFRADRRVVRLYCSARGFSRDVEDELARRMLDREQAFEKLVAADVDGRLRYRYQAVTFAWCDEEVIRMKDGDPLFRPRD